MESTAEIAAVLRALRRRMTAALFLSRWARATLFFFGVLVALRGIAWWIGQSRPDASSLPIMLSWPFVLGAIGATVITLLRRPSLAAVAAAIDAAGDTRDRLLTALHFTRKPNATELERLAIREAQAWITAHDLRPLVALRVPRVLGWLAVPLAMLALLWWHEADRAAQRDAAIAAARAETRGVTKALDQLAQTTEQKAGVTQDETLRRVAERLKQSAAQLRAEAEEGKKTGPAALRQIAELEQLIKQLRQPEIATPAELKALAQALAQHESTREAAQDMEQNRLEDAARKLEEASARPEAEKVAAALQQAVEHLARRQEQASKQVEELQHSQATQAQPGNSPATEKLLQQVAQMLREIAAQQDPQNGAGKPGEDGKTAGQKDDAQKQKQKQRAGKSLTDDELKKLLGALQEMKDQPPGTDESEDGSPGEESGQGAGPVSMLSFQQNPAGDPSSQMGAPSGRPGSEQDRGTTKDPFGAEGPGPGSPQRQERLQGQLGEGESLSALIPAARGGDTKSARRYQEVTEAAAAAAADTVSQEEIPLGSRVLIRRYFEAIRARQ